MEGSPVTQPLRRRSWQSLAAIAAGLSAQAVAAVAGKAATGAVPPVHISAASGAFVGSLFLLLIPVADAAMAVLKDVGWIKRLLFVALRPVRRPAHRS